MIRRGSKYVKGYGESSAASISEPHGLGLLVVETASSLFRSTGEPFSLFNVSPCRRQTKLTHETDDT